MKRLFSLTLFIVGTVMTLCAQTAILVRDTQPVSAFYGAAALANAVNAAEPAGDIIVLSSGTFNNPGEIKKSVSIYGQGHEGPDRTIIRDKLSLRPSEAGSIDNIHLEGLYLENHFNILNDGNRSPISGLTVVKCHITGIFFYMDSNDVILRNCVIQGDFKTYPGSYTATNMLIENCWKDGGSFNVFTTESTITVRNSIFNHRALSGFDASSAACKATFENSVIAAYSLAAGSTATNCVLLAANTSTGDVTTTNCWEVSSVPEAFTNAESLVYEEGSVPAVKAEYVGTDNTPVGITGGNYPWSVVPSQPTVNYETTLIKDADGYYKVGSVEDWKELKRVVENLDPLANAKMTADIDLGDDQTMIGTAENPFCGIFDGQGHTLAIHYVSNVVRTAPLWHVFNATVRNLHTTGTMQVDGNAGNCGSGMVGYAQGTNVIERCHSSVNITATGSGDTFAGFVGVNFRGTLTFTDCVFDGSIATSSRNHCGGFVGYTDNGTTTATNCLLTATFDLNINSYNVNFLRYSGIVSNCHYLNGLGVNQGIQATAEELANGRTAFYLQAGREELFWGQEIGVDPLPVLTSDESKRVYRAADGYTNNPDLATSDQSLVPLLYTRDSNNELTITGFDPGFVAPADYQLVIPDEIDGAPVTAVAASAFFQKSNFTSLYIGKNVKTIGNEAFRQAKAVSLIIFADDCVVENFGGSAFRGCDELTSFTMPGSVKTIGDMCFQANPKLASVTLSNQLMAIAPSAFNNCPLLNDVVIPESVATIHNSAFSTCSALTSITIPATVTAMGTYVFQNCTSLQTATFAEGTTLTVIPEGTFDGCTALGEFTIPASINAINAYAFRNCTALPAISFPSTLTKLGGEAFRNCSSLKEVTIPATIMAMDANVFWNSGVEKADVSCPVMGQGTFYQCASLESVTIHESVTTIGLGAFHGCVKLPAVDIPGTVTTISENAFRECSSLTSIVIPASVTSICNYAFAGCAQLQSAIFADGISLAVIPVGCFYECRALENISIPASVTSIDGDAFRRCSAMTSVNFPDNTVLTTIGDGAFRGCAALPSIVIPESVTSIGALGFQACTLLEEITLPSTLQVIRAQLFQESGLKHITLPATVKTIENNAFYSAVQLEEVSFPQGLATIGNSAFRYCEKLNNVVLPASLTSIQDWAFANCPAMENLTLEEGITSINRDVFQFSGMKKVVLPSTLGFIGVNLFHQCNQLEELDLSRCVNVWELYNMTTVDRTGGWNIFFGVPATTLVKMPAYAKVEAASNVEVDKESFDLAQDEEGYYLINDADDWDKFVVYSRANPTINGRLTADIDLTGHEGKLGVGNGESSYFTWQGTLDGQGHYLTIRYKTNKEFVGGVFAYTENATIKNLRVRGTVDVIYRVVGGFVGFVKDALTIQDCESDIDFTVTPSTTNMHVAGFIGQGKQGNITLTDCLYKGSITGISNFRYAAGFLGWMENGGQMTYNYCLNNGVFTGMDLNYAYTLGATQSKGQSTAVACYGNVDGGGRISPENLYTPVSTEQLKSGMVAYRLQGGRDEQHWGQKIGTDPAPRLTNEDGTRVYRGQTYTNEYVEYAGLQKDEDGYYLIGSPVDWEEFVTIVEDFPLSNARMTADVEIVGNVMVGTKDVPYAGTFDGQGHMLTFHFNTLTMYPAPGESYLGAAPFWYANGATFRNVHTAGTVEADKIGASGLVGWTLGTTTIEQCWSEVNFSSLNNTSDTYAGFVALQYGQQLTMNNCIYTGRIQSESNISHGGFVGYHYSGTATVNNSLLLLAEGSDVNISSSVYTRFYTFVRYRPEAVVINNCYYLTPLGVEQGTQVTAEQLASGYTTFKLQGKSEDVVWVQTIGTDAYPQLAVFNPTGQRVYRTPDGYSNTPDEGALVQDADGYYLLASVEDWKRFAMYVSDGFVDMNVRMISDIDLGTDQTMIGDGQAANDYGGTGSIKYQGIFDGQGHTLTINYVASNEQTAPFRYIQNATIKNLHVEGGITTAYACAAGIVSICYGQQIHSYIENCVSSVHIFSSYKNTGGFYSGASHGGIAANLNYYGQLHITDCVFDGSIRGENTDVVWGGMMGVPDGTVTLTNCLQVGEFNCSGVIGGGNGSGTFSCVFGNGYASRVNVVNCYYLNQLGNAQGTQATETTLADGSVTAALQAGREEEIWTQNPYTNQPMLRLFYEDYNPDGIKAIEHSPLNIDHSVYDLSGRKMVEAKLPKGIYIIDGKKVLVK